ncbi:hypothetical protein FCV25MIE_16420 [Fagus crenata]
MARKRFRNVGTGHDVSRLQPIHARKQLNNFSNIDVLQGEVSLKRGVPSFTVVTPFQHNIITGRIECYYAQLRRRLIMARKRFRNLGTVLDVPRLQPIHAGKQLNNFSNVDAVQGEAIQDMNKSLCLLMISGLICQTMNVLWICRSFIRKGLTISILV